MPLEEREMSSVRVPQGGLRSFDVKEKVLNNLYGWVKAALFETATLF
jgi:hypothetical protein